MHWGWQMQLAIARKGIGEIGVPGADGYEVARRLSAICEISRKVVYFALTGFAQLNDFQRSEETD